MRTPLLRAALLLALATPSRNAAAHGSYPIALDMFFPAGDDSMVVETNFGLIRRDGEAWRLLCEEAISPGVKWFLVDETGRIAIGHGGGYSTSTDGCGFAESAGVESSVRWIERVATGSGTPPHLFVLLDLYEPGRNLLRSRDGGLTFERVTTPEGLLVNAVRADRSTPERVLATAQTPEKTYVLLESLDFGATWSERPLPGLPGIARIMGVSESGVFVRTSQPGSHLVWRADDAASELAQVLALTDQPAFLADVGSGVLWTSTGNQGKRRSTDGGRTWAEVEVPGDLLCMKRRGSRLFACTTDRETNAAVSVSDDEGATWQIALKFGDVQDVVSCPDESDVGRACPALWPLIEPALKNEQPANPIPEPEPEPGPSCASAGVAGLAVIGVAWRRRRRGVDGAVLRLGR